MILPAPQSATATLAGPSLKDRSRRSFVSILIIVLFWGSTYAAGMFTPPLLDDADSLHAEVAREMLQRQDWVTLYTDGIRYLEKAPLMYWAIALSYRLLGVKDWSTRLPLMLGVLVLLVATYALGTLCYGESGGFWSAMVLSTSIGPYIFTRFQIPDVLVGLWLTAALYFFMRSLEEDPPSRLNCWGLAAACACNVLTKGLIGLVFPVAIIGLYLILTSNLHHLRKLRPVSSGLVFLAIAVPWHALAAVCNPNPGGHGFLWFYFINEQFLRYLNKRVPPGYDTVPLLIFWGLLLVWLVPWTIFLPATIRTSARGWHRPLRGLEQPHAANLLFAIWALVIVVFFSFSTRQEYYTMPALPALALLIGGWLAKEAAGSTTACERRAGKRASLIFVILAGLIFAMGVRLLVSSRPPGPGADLADLLKRNPTEYNLSLGHLLDLTPQALGIFRGPLLITLLCLLGGAGCNYIFRSRQRPMAGNFALAFMMVGMIGAVHSAFVKFSPILSSQPLAESIRQYYRPGDTIVVDGEYHQASTLNFYTGVPLRVLHEPSGNLWFGSKFSDAPRVFLTQNEFASLWSGNGMVFLWTDQEEPADLHGAQYFPLARSGGKSVLTNHPVGH